MRPVPAVGAIVLDGAGRLLVVRRGRPPGEGLWSVPGGKVEMGEKLADAVVREVREETGLEVTCGRLVEVVERWGDGWHYVILDYLCEACGGALCAGDDVSDARWVTRAELDLMPTTEGLGPVIDLAFAAAGR